MRIPQIAIFPAREYVHHERLLSALSELYVVKFVPGRKFDPLAYDAALMFDSLYSEAVRSAQLGLRCLAFLRADRKPLQTPSGDVVFGDTVHLSPLFRAATLPATNTRKLCDIKFRPEDEIVARKGTDVLWVRHDAGPAAAELLAMGPPALAPSEFLFEHWSDSNWLSLLPLLHFVQTVSGWETPRIRACFMFDDPNLHWKSYGYVNYREVAEAAKTENFHVSFATVPFDAWYIHGPTARLFRDNCDRLSLLVHGNDHTHFELHRAPRPLALAVQALRRVEDLERRGGLQVSKIMVAPHGACNENMAHALLQTGFEAACISRGSLMTRNPEVKWPLTVGLRPAEFFGRGLPVLLRVGMRPESETRFRLAAFLGQPIIPVGHHDDLRGGLERLNRLARVINSLGSVDWLDMGSIARTNYLARQNNDVFRVRLYSRTVRLRISATVETLCVERPWLTAGAAEDLGVANGMANNIMTPNIFHMPDGVPIPVEGDAMITIRARPPQIDPRRMRIQRTRLNAIARRQFCEVRDRILPTVDRFFRSRNQ